MNYRLGGLIANMVGTVLLLVAGGFESGRGILEQGGLPYPRVGWWLYVAGFGILLLGFVLQFGEAWRDRQRILH